MRNQARLALAVVIFMAAAMVLPRGASRYVAPDANAQVPTPLLSELLGSPSPSPSDDPDPDPGGGGGGGEEPGGGSGGGGGGGGGTGGGGGGGSGSGGGDAKGDNKDGKGKAGAGKGLTEAEQKRRKKKRKRLKNDVVVPQPSIAGRIAGAYDTSQLVAVAIRLRSLGMSAEEVVRKVYPPFIIAGKASWIDTWGAPRYGPAPGQIRTHEGQDVFCDYGDPILAPEAGTVSTDDSGLGGITARVHRPDGKYWYMTHLSGLNKSFPTGSQVQRGDVVGYCGNSGNAATTPPHVHFGFYGEGGVNPTNPMKHLIAWLDEAERRVLGVVVKTTTKRQKQVPTLTAARRFGDAFAPDRSQLRFSGESLWAAGQSPASGAFGLAQAALQEALSTNGIELGIVPTPVDLQLPQDEGRSSLPPDSALAQMLESSTHTHSHTEGTD